MAFRAYIESIRMNESGSADFFVNIKFEDQPTGRVLFQEYKYVAGTTREQFEQMVLVRRNELRNLDAAYAVFDNNLGVEIT